MGLNWLGATIGSAVRLEIQKEIVKLEKEIDACPNTLRGRLRKRKLEKKVQKLKNRLI